MSVTEFKKESIPSTLENFQDREEVFAYIWTLVLQFYE